MYLKKKKFSDLSISSSEKPKNLCDLPMEIVEMIVEKLDFTRRSFVRQTCKTLRKMIDGLKPCCCIEIKITIGLEECELKLEGHSIKYKRSEGEDPKKIVESMLERMFSDLLTFVPNLQTNTFIVKFHDDRVTLPIFCSVYEKYVRQPMKVRSLVYQTYIDWALCFGHEIINYKEIHVTEYQIMEKYEEGIIKVKVHRIEWPDLLDNEGNRRLKFSPSYFKYYREGHEDILVDEPNQLAPKETRVETAETTQND